MKPKVEIKKGSGASKSFIDNYNKMVCGVFNCPPNEDLSKDILFVVRDGRRIVSFGALTPVKINYNKKDYNILGITEVASLEKRKGYGRTLTNSMIDYLRIKDKTGFGFCSSKVAKFYDKCGMKTKKKLGRRFFYDYGDEKKNEHERDLDVVYYEGKDKFISKVLDTKSIIKLPCEHW
ncbi:MAG: GNAT family N-acetyltransferase [archaeon]